jgi:hypothetical protein
MLLAIGKGIHGERFTAPRYQKQCVPSHLSFVKFIMNEKFDLNLGCCRASRISSW